MQIRITPSFVVAVLALLVAVSGTGYAAGKINSNQIKNNTVQSKDIKDGSLQGSDLKDRTITGADVAERSIPRTKIETRCAAGDVPVFDGCTKKAPTVPIIDYDYGTGTTWAKAAADCHKRGARLPSLVELEWIRTHPAQYTWADGNRNNYEFTGEMFVSDSGPATPMGVDGNGQLIRNASVQAFHYHCITE